MVGKGATSQLDIYGWEMHGAAYTRRHNDSITHMTDNDLLSPEQHGFIQGRSCVTQLLAVLDSWTLALDEGGNIDTIYLDFAKAFNTVPHQRLLMKLRGYGIEGRILTWIEAFLTDRRHRSSSGQRQPVVMGRCHKWNPAG